MDLNCFNRDGKILLTWISSSTAVTLNTEVRVGELMSTEVKKGVLMNRGGPPSLTTMIRTEAWACFCMPVGLLSYAITRNWNCDSQQIQRVNSYIDTFL